MSIKDREISLRFTQPINQIITMFALVLLVGVGGYLSYSVLSPIFFTSPYLNGFIVIMFFFGVIACFWQVLTMMKSVNWIESFALDLPGHNLVKAPSLLASLAAFLSERTARFALTATSTRSILDSLAVRLDEGREITRYVINLLIFLGLLGTFYGLATTIPAVVDTIRSLAPDNGDAATGFANLMTGLEAQLGGMGTAFGSSLLGLAGSLILGLLDLFAGRAQNRFYRELEEWLSSITKIGGHLEGGDENYSAGMFESAGLQMKELQNILAQTAGHLEEMVNSVNGLVAHAIKTETISANALTEIAMGQSRIVQAIDKMQSEGEGILDAQTRMRLRNIDENIAYMNEDGAQARVKALRELRSDFDRLTKTVSKLAKD